MAAYAFPIRGSHRVFEWGKRFVQRDRRAYPAEDTKLTPAPDQSLTDAFFEELGSRLDPPQFNYTNLRRFLANADEEDLRSPTSSSRYDLPLVLLDDRRDVTGWLDPNGDHHSARDWDNYATYPPEGEKPTISLMHAQDLYQKQLRSVNDFRSSSPAVLP